MSRRHPRFESSWGPLDRITGRTDEVDRANVVGVAPVVAGTGFVLSRAIAMLIADASGLAFLWGLVIGLGLATAGVVVLASTETDSRTHRGTHAVARVPLATAGGVLLLSLLTGLVLGTVL